MTTIDPTASVNPEIDKETGGAPKWVPTILLHVLYPDSRKVGFGWILFIVATWATFFGRGADAKALLDAQTWLLCVSMTSLLIGGGTIMDAKHEQAMAKINGGTDAPVTP